MQILLLCRLYAGKFLRCNGYGIPLENGLYLRFESRSCQYKDNENSNCCFSDKHAALRNKIKVKDSFVRVQENVPWWGHMSNNGLLLQ